MKGGRYWLGGAGAHWLDTKAFLEGIRHARIENDRERAISTYKKALLLYRGDYLADLSSTSIWSAGEQHRYQESYLSALEELGTLYERQGLSQEARETYLQATAAAPWRETAARKLIRLLIQAGNRAEAIMQCQRLRSALEGELGIKPCKETLFLCQELTHGP